VLGALEADAGVEVTPELRAQVARARES
jgi:hypothetical protein